MSFDIVQDVITRKNITSFILLCFCTEIKLEYDGFQFKRPKIGFEDNQPLETRVENRNRSLSSAKGQTLPTKNYVSVHPSYLRTLGQAHSDWLFGAVAELVDNSRDAKATMYVFYCH